MDFVFGILYITIVTNCFRIRHVLEMLVTEYVLYCNYVQCGSATLLTDTGSQLHNFNRNSREWKAAFITPKPLGSKTYTKPATSPKSGLL